MTIFGCLKIESRALIHPAKKKPAVICDGRLFFGAQQISAADTPRNAY
jgi:hypothetical protein